MFLDIIFVIRTPVIVFAPLFMCYRYCFVKPIELMKHSKQTYVKIFVVHFSAHIPEKYAIISARCV